MNERITATAMSCSSSARLQNETAIATATSASDAATSLSVIETVLLTTRPGLP